MKKFFVVLMLMVFGTAGMVFAAPDTQVDALIAKLIEKGILDQEEADVLKSQVAYDAKEIQSANMKKDLPEWVQNTKLTGDFRIRNQYEKRKNSSSTQEGRNRVRMRARLGVETKINDTFKMAVGLATDGGSARSSNYTFNSSFAKGNVVLNYAYGQWEPNKEWKLTAGQMKNPIWEPMEFLWDGDITPQGGAIEYTKKLSDYLQIDVLGSGFVVKELASSNADPYLWVGQIEARGMLLNEKTDYRLAGMYNYVQNNTKSTFGSSSYNTFQASKYKYNYNIPVGAVELGINDPLGEDFPIYVPRIAVFGEYAYNPQPEDENVAWMAGAYLGNAKVANKGAWKLTGAYKSLGRDAWLDAFPDSDFYGGSTDSKGYEAIFEYGLAKNITLSVDYYYTERKSSMSNSLPESIIQTDINWKF